MIHSFSRQYSVPWRFKFEVHMRPEAHQLERARHWSTGWRLVVVLLAASSIWCLLAEMYGLCSMRVFTIWILIPATIVLYALAAWDRTAGDGTLWRGVVIGSVSGFLAAVAYDVFRLPFVFSN